MKISEQYLFKIANILHLKYVYGQFFSGPLKVEDIDGMLEDATDTQRAFFSTDILHAAQTAIRGKSLKELHALPINGEEDLIIVNRIKTSPRFQNEGNVEDTFGNSPGGLPRFNLDADGQTYLVNGRHRLTAAREMGRASIIARLAKRNADGWILWEAELPVMI